MNIFYYQPGPAGSGKTHQLAHWAASVAASHGKVLIAQPTTALIRATVAKIRSIDPSIKVTPIYARRANDRVTARTLDHMNAAAPHAGEILIVTHETLKRLPTNRRKFWHMVCDEVPAVLEHIDLRIAQTHQHVTDHIAAEEVVPGLLSLAPGNRAALEAVQVNATEDQNIATFERLVSTLLSGDHFVMVDSDAYRDLLENPQTRGRLDFFAVLMPDFVSGYASTTFMGANIEETELFVVWKALFDIDWARHPVMGDKLRYETHQNGSRLTIGYLFDGRLSKRFLGAEDELGGTTFDQVTGYVARYWDAVPFLWQANKDAMPVGFDYASRLPGVSHGLDKAEWKRVHNVALLSAMNRKSAAYGFLVKLGISAEQAQATLAWQNDYQSMMRCSLRDPDAVAPVRVIVGSRDGAEWIAAKFPGCIIEKLDSGIEEPRRSGRPEGATGTAKTGAERAREARARKRAAKERQTISVNCTNRDEGA